MTARGRLRAGVMVAGSGRGGLRGLLRMQQQPAARRLGRVMIAANATMKGRKPCELREPA